MDHCNIITQYNKALNQIEHLPLACALVGGLVHILQ